MFSIKISTDEWISRSAWLSAKYFEFDFKSFSVSVVTFMKHKTDVDNVNCN